MERVRTVVVHSELDGQEILHGTLVDDVPIDRHLGQELLVEGALVDGDAVVVELGGVGDLEVVDVDA